MTNTWPSTLPSPLSGTLEKGDVSPWVSDGSEVGAPRRRKRFTRSLATFKFDMLLSEAQLATLETFYTTTLDHGVENFEWTHPKTSTVYTVQFNAKFKEKHRATDYYDITVELSEI
jgi:phage-related protein